MSTISIGGFNLDSNEIIYVTHEEVGYALLTKRIVGFIIMFGTLGTLGSINKGEFFWAGVILLVFTIFISVFYFFVSDLLRERYKFEITVKTMSNGQIKTHKKVFDMGDNSYVYYKELKTYI